MDYVSTGGTHMLAFVIGVASSLVAEFVFREWLRSRRARPLNALLNFGADDLLFIFPHREMPESILPRTSTEDVFAINNFISALIAIGWSRQIRMRDTTRLSADDKKKNLVSICSSKTNVFTKELMALLREKGVKTYWFEATGANDEWELKDRNGRYPSPSYASIRDFRAKGLGPAQIVEEQLEDLAVVMKVTNPWNALNKIFVIAGIRGIGTWGAAECVKKNWKSIHNQVKDNPRADFAALLRVTYKNCDIVGTEVVDVRPL